MQEKVHIHIEVDKDYRYKIKGMAVDLKVTVTQLIKDAIDFYSHNLEEREK